MLRRIAFWSRTSRLGRLLSRCKRPAHVRRNRSNATQTEMGTAYCFTAQGRLRQRHRKGRSDLGNGRVVMNSCAAIILFLLLFIGSLVYAQSPCADCFNAVEDALKACLGSAISVDDQTVCGDRRSEQLRVCGKGDECRTERAKPEQKTDAPPPQKRLSVEERLQQLIIVIRLP